MTEINYSTLLREVVSDYFEKRLTRTEYLALRHQILSKIDHEFNGEDDCTEEEESDVTQPSGRGANFPFSKTHPHLDSDNESV